MRILAISSSSRRNGNSETLLDRALFGLKKKGTVIKKVILTELNISPCVAGCQACYKIGECIIKDDMQDIYKDLLACDMLITASPIYFQGLPGQLKCAIDRCQALWARKFVLKKELVDKKSKAKRQGTAILVCASRGVKNTFTGAVITLKAWYNTLDIKYKKEFLAEGLEQESAALKDKKLLKRAVEFGKKLI